MTYLQIFFNVLFLLIKLEFDIIWLVYLVTSCSGVINRCKNENKTERRKELKKAYEQKMKINE